MILGVKARTLASILVDAGVITPDQVDAALVLQRSTGLRIGETLVEMGAATEEDIGWALARQLGLPFVDLSPETLDADLVRSFPEGLLFRLDAVPLVNEESSLSVALADPTDTDHVDELERAADQMLTLAVATPTAIRAVLRKLLGPRPELHTSVPPTAPDAHFDIEWDRSGATFLLFHLSEARRAGASEIHFLARREALEVHHRIGTQLVKARNEPPGALYYLLARLEALGGPVINDRIAHVARSVLCPSGGETLELDVSLLHHQEGFSVTIELRPSSTALPPLDQLGFDPVDVALLRAALQASAGLGIVTGPPGMGGSTTLACLLADMGFEDRRCIAFGNDRIRVPAEVYVPGLDAPPVWTEVAVAQCADIVVLDGILAGNAVNATLSPAALGRLLLVRTDWTDTFALLEQLSAHAQDRVALAARLMFVVQQRLVRVDGAPAAADASGLRYDRRAILEVLIAGDSLRDGILAGEAAPQLRARAVAEGFRPLAARLRALADSGVIPAAESARMLG